MIDVLELDDGEDQEVPQDDDDEVPQDQREELDVDDLLEGWMEQFLSVQDSLGQRWVSLAKIGAVLATIALGLALLALALAH